MTEAKQAMIYATGSDSELRQMCFALLEAGLVSKVDLIDRGKIYLTPNGDSKVGWSGRVVVLICKRAALKKVMARMKKEYIDDDLEAYAVPVLLTL